MRYLTERLRQTVFLLVGFPFLRLFSACWSPAFAGFNPQSRRLTGKLFFETQPQPGTHVAADSGLEPESIGFTRQKSSQHLCGQHAERGFR
jgi:hypothetical protein